MKKLLIGYLCVVVAILTLPFGYHFLMTQKGPQPQGGNVLPKTIAVYETKLDKVTEMDFEQYIKGVIPGEMPGKFHDEALKAQAVAARTYAYYKYKKFTANAALIPPRHKGAVVCSDPAHCNAYYNEAQLLEKNGESWMKQYYNKFCNAVEATRGEVMLYNEQPILAAFHSSSGGGRTENCSDVWGGEYPYLVSVASMGEEREPSFVSTVMVSKQQFRDKIKEYDPNAKLEGDPKEWIQNVVFTQGSSVKQLEVGGVVIPGTKMRTLFSLRSAQFVTKWEGDQLVFTIEGYGHGVGMSQYGANYMAEQGKGYQEILQAYYQNVKIAK